MGTPSHQVLPILEDLGKEQGDLTGVGGCFLFPSSATW